MQHLFARLLSNQAKLDRRQLLQGLALSATGAVAARAMPGPGGAPLKAIAVNHISYTVPDYAKTRDFYSDLLGMTVVWDDGNQCALEFGDPAAPNALYLRKLQQPGDRPNVDHLAFSIDHFDKDAVGAELKRRGLDPRPDGPLAWSIHDPDGYRIQICAKKGVYPGATSLKESDGQKNLKAVPAPSGKGFKAIAVNHISYGVPDYAKARDFYSDLLGMQVVLDTGKQVNLVFGDPQDCILVRKTRDPNNRVLLDHFAFTIENFDKDGVQAELKRRGLDPKPDSRLAWSIKDPDGFTVQICSKDLLHYVETHCVEGNANRCTG